jgi:hypothetical protein
MRDDELLRRYLLGALPEAEAAELEPRLLAEADLFDLAEAIESEILEDYARGELAPADHEHVARYLASSPSGRLRLAVVRGLAALSANLAQPTGGQILPFPRPAAKVLRPRDLAAVLAAMLVMTLAGILGVWLRIEPPRSVAQTPAPVVFTAATMILSSVRGNQDIPSVQVPTGTDVVELPLLLSQGDDTYPSYQIVLEDQVGEEVLSRADLHAEKSRLILQVDAERLRTGRYTLEVAGLDREGAATPIDFKEFEVRKP